MPPDQLPKFIDPKQYLTSKKSYKKGLIVGLLTILMLIGIVVTTNLAGTQQLIKSKASELTGEVTPQLISETSVTEASLESHPNLFLAVLEYDPATGIVNQLNQDFVHGDPQPLFAEKPNDNSTLYNFRVESLSEQGEILTTGWMTVYKEIAQRSDGKLVFNVSLYFDPNSIVNLYLPNNQLVWTISMNSQE